MDEDVRKALAGHLMDFHHLGAEPFEWGPGQLEEAHLKDHKEKDDIHFLSEYPQKA